MSQIGLFLVLCLAGVVCFGLFYACVNWFHKIK